MKKPREAVCYSDMQRAPLCLLVYAPGVLVLGLRLTLRDQPIPWLFPPIWLVLLVLAGSIQHLTVKDEGEVLDIRFGAQFSLPGKLKDLVNQTRPKCVSLKHLTASDREMIDIWSFRSMCYLRSCVICRPLGIISHASGSSRWHKAALLDCQNMRR